MLSNLLEQLIDQTTGLDTIELLDAETAEAIPGQGFDVGLVELVLVDELEDQIPLLVGAFPLSVAGSAPVGCDLSIMSVPVGPGSIAVSVLGDETGMLDLLIHTLLERLVEAGAFACDVVGVADLRLDADGELVARIPAETRSPMRAWRISKRRTPESQSARKTYFITSTVCCIRQATAAATLTTWARNSRVSLP